MAQLFKNNARTFTSGTINGSVTIINLVSGGGAQFPAPTGSDYFLATLSGVDAEGVENAWEIVKVTSRSTDTLTVVRAQESTPGVTWASGTSIELRMTAASATAFEAKSEKVERFIGGNWTPAASVADTYEWYPNGEDAMLVLPSPLPTGKVYRVFINDPSYAVTVSSQGRTIFYDAGDGTRGSTTANVTFTDVSGTISLCILSSTQVLLIKG